MAWTPTEYLLAEITDAIRGGNWQRSGGKGSRPRRIPRPGAEKRIGRARPLGEVRDLFDRWRNGQIRTDTTKGVTYG